MKSIQIFPVYRQVYSETMAPWWKDQPYKFADNIWQMYDNSDIRVVSGDYLKVQNISLRYSVPEEWCKKMNLTSLYLSISATELYTWASKKLKGQDPTTQSGSSSTISVPSRPSFTFNLNVSF